jgi:hypothetical protein
MGWATVWAIFSRTRSGHPAADPVLCFKRQKKERKSFAQFFSLTKK